MTCTEIFGKVAATLEHDSGCLGTRSREVDLTVTWVSCGVFQVEYWRPRDAEKHEVMVVEDWYPPDTSISFTPEQFDKVTELFPGAPKHNKREECYKPFYEDYDLDRGMFDWGYDSLFQAFKDPRDNVEMVWMVRHIFVWGKPTESTQVLGLEWKDFLKLKELIDGKRDWMLYSGCKFGPSGVEAIWVTDKEPEHTKK